MRLSKRHIGGLFDVHGSDGSWCYQLIDIRKNVLLFYAFDGKHWTEKKGKTDWRRFKSQLPSPSHIAYGWISAQEIK